MPGITAQNALLGRRGSHPANDDEDTNVTDQPASRPPDRDEDLSVTYERMRSIARRRLATRGALSLHATELVNEAWIRIHGRGTDGASHDRLLMMAARAMRDILVDEARRRGALKRGGDWQRVSWETAATVATDHPSELLELDDAITKLEDEDPETAAVVQLKFFAGLTGDETAEVLSLSPATVDRRWHYARTRLHELLTGD